MSDYITCSRCGVVPRGHICPHKKDNRKKESNEVRRFRNTKAWARKSIEIRERDKYLCRVCMSNKYNTIDIYNYNKLEVHHIIPIEQDYNKRLDNDNLITLCAYHHHLAEVGEIPREELQIMVEEK